MEVQIRGSALLLTSKNGNLQIIAQADGGLNLHKALKITEYGLEHPLKAMSIPEMFNHKEYGNNIAPYSKLNPFFGEHGIGGNKYGILRQSSPMATSDFGALSEIPLYALPTENGKLYIVDTHFNGNLFGGFTLDELVKAGINVEVPVFFAIGKGGCKITSENEAGSSYAIRVIQMMPEQLKKVLRPFYNPVCKKAILAEDDRAIEVALLDNKLGAYITYYQPGPFVPGWYLGGHEFVSDSVGIHGKCAGSELSEIYFGGAIVLP